MKMNLKYALSIILTVCILTATFAFEPLKAEDGGNVSLPYKITVVPAGSPSPWAKSSIDALNAKKLIPADLNQRYKNSITRAEFAALLANAYEYAKKETIQKKEHSFTDIKGHQYEDALVKAKSAGLINGVSAASMNPDGTLTREQAATMLGNLIQNAENIDLSLHERNGKKFSDDADISSWAAKSVYYAFDEGIISGTGDNKFSPKINLTREAAMVLVNRTIEKFGW